MTFKELLEVYDSRYMVMVFDRNYPRGDVNRYKFNSNKEWRNGNMVNRKVKRMWISNMSLDFTDISELRDYTPNAMEDCDVEFVKNDNDLQIITFNQYLTVELEQ